ncbi:hypothetical protein HCO69_08150 [Pantoea sp. LS15]|uniref:hypothetical protein n=1 Tax=Enterobacterales TaxID=91347 RepID=UPI000E0EFF80|nr:MULTISPECIES: hypothetical protein [Enterobacterales]NJQ19604.1 hypothetical protein [Pantoea sp. LS15]NKF46200.1 hypothetical protein [Pantoea sp. LS15]RDK14994.1 hypothetical protein CEJ32_08320 [Enterobacter sp. 9-2]
MTPRMMTDTQLVALMQNSSQRIDVQVHDNGPDLPPTHSWSVDGVPMHHLAVEVIALVEQKTELLKALEDLSYQVCEATSRRPLNEARETADAVIARIKGGTA